MLMIILQKAKVHNDRTLPFQFGLHGKKLYISEVSYIRNWNINQPPTLTPSKFKTEASKSIRL